MALWFLKLTLKLSSAWFSVSVTLSVLPSTSTGLALSLLVTATILPLADAPCRLGVMNCQTGVETPSLSYCTPETREETTLVWS